MYLFCIITNGLHQVNTKSELLEYKVMRQYKYSQSRNWYDCTV